MRSPICLSLPLLRARLAVVLLLFRRLVSPTTVTTIAIIPVIVESPVTCTVQRFVIFIAVERHHVVMILGLSYPRFEAHFQTLPDVNADGINLRWESVGNRYDLLCAVSDVQGDFIEVLADTDCYIDVFTSLILG